MNYLGYSVTFGYLEKTTLSTGESYTHRGIDLGAWTGQPVVVAGTQIGLAGATGKAEGPHVHIQAGRDEWAQQTLDPAPYIGQPGVVVKTGTASQWGNYVCVRVGDVNVYYCHLSRVDVEQGFVIEEEAMPTREDVIKQFQAFKSSPPSEAEIEYFSAHPWNVLNEQLLVWNRDKRQALEKLVDRTDDDAELGRKVRELVNQ